MQNPAILAQTREALSGNLYIATGRNDEIDLFAPAEVFHHQLERLDIDHVFEPSDTGHFDGVQERLSAGLAFVLDRISGTGGTGSGRPN